MLGVNMLWYTWEFTPAGAGAGSRICAMTLARATANSGGWRSEPEVARDILHGCPLHPPRRLRGQAWGEGMSAQRPEMHVTIQIALGEIAVSSSPGAGTLRWSCEPAPRTPARTARAHSQRTSRLNRAPWPLTWYGSPLVCPLEVVLPEVWLLSHGGLTRCQGRDTSGRDRREAAAG